MGLYFINEVEAKCCDRVKDKRALEAIIPNGYEESDKMCVVQKLSLFLCMTKYFFGGEGQSRPDLHFVRH